MCLERMGGVWCVGLLGRVVSSGFGSEGDGALGWKGRRG